MLRPSLYPRSRKPLRSAARLRAAVATESGDMTPTTGIAGCCARAASGHAAADGTLDALPSAARRLGLDARVYEARAAADIETTLTAAGRDGVQALYVSQSPVFLHRRAEIIGRVASMRLPAMYFFREFVQSGGLLSYGSDLADMYRRAGVYIDKILKGASPSELPVQSAEKFELAVNLKTAKALGLTISESFLLRADEVIE